jgi:hypothetical protein
MNKKLKAMIQEERERLIDLCLGTIAIRLMFDKDPSDEYMKGYKDGADRILSILENL